jgi:hypothetical protein
MSDIIAAARARLAQLEQESETIRKFLESAEAVATYLGAHSLPEATETLQPVNPVEMSRTSQEASQKRVSDNPKPEVVIPTVRQILIESGRPMSRSELHEALMQKGLEVRGVDPVKTLGTMLWRARDEIQAIKGEGYWPIDVPHPDSLEGS